MNYVSLQGEIAIVNIDLFCSVLYEGGTHWIPPPEFASQDDITKFSDHNCCVSLSFVLFMPFPSVIVLNLCIIPNKLCYVRSHTCTFTVNSHMPVK